MSYIKRVTYKIRSARSPLIIGPWGIGAIWVNWTGLDWVFWSDFLGGGSEKGNTRKHTENWVTRWGSLYWRNLTILCWIAKRIGLGEFNVGGFWVFGRCSHVGLGGGGPLVCFMCVVGEFIVCWLYDVWQKGSIELGHVRGEGFDPICGRG
jgi:hypothetical protein